MAILLFETMIKCTLINFMFYSIKESFSANPHSFVQDRLTFANSKRNIFWPIMKMLFPETNFCCVFQTDHHFVGIVDRPEKNLELKLLPSFLIKQTSSFEAHLRVRTFPLIQFSIFIFLNASCHINFVLCISGRHLVMYL